MVTGMVAHELTTMRSSSRPGVISRIRSTRTVGSGSRVADVAGEAHEACAPGALRSPEHAVGHLAPDRQAQPGQGPDVRVEQARAPWPGATASTSPDRSQTRTLAPPRPRRGRAAAADAGRAPAALGHRPASWALGGARGGGAVVGGWCCRHREDLVTWAGGYSRGAPTGARGRSSLHHRSGRRRWKPGPIPPDHPRSGAAAQKDQGRRSGTTRLPTSPMARRA